MDFNPKASLIMVDYWEKKRFPKRVNLELAKEALESIQKFYPELNIILVTDYPHDSKLNKIQKNSCRLVYVPGLGDYSQADFGTGHGIGIDEGLKYAQSEYFFTADRDIIMKKKGWLEKLSADLSEKIVAVGPGFNNNAIKVGRNRSFAGPHLSAYRLEPIKKFHLSFAQVYLTGLAFSTGQFLCYRLASLGYDFAVKNIGSLEEYIIHGRGAR